MKDGNGSATAHLEEIEKNALPLQVRCLKLQLALEEAERRTEIAQTSLRALKRDVKELLQRFSYIRGDRLMPVVELEQLRNVIDQFRWVFSSLSRQS